MHIRRISQVRTVKAYDVEYILDLILQLINVLESVEGFFGLNLFEKEDPQQV